MENNDIYILPNFEIKDERFDTNQIGDCHLLIEVSQEYFRFAVYSTTFNAIMWLEDYHAFSLLLENKLLNTLKKIYQEHPFLAANYWKTIRLSITAPHFTLIPDEFYEPNEAGKYLSFAAGKNLSETEQILDFKINRFEMVCVYGVEKELINWFKEMYPARKIEPIPVIGSLLEGIVQDRNNEDLHFYFEDHYVTIIYFKDSKLHFCNRFHFLTPQDMVYHILFVINELNLQDDISATYYGEITSFSEGFMQLSQSFAMNKFAQNPKKLNFSEDFEDLPEHRYYTLFSSYYLY